MNTRHFAIRSAALLIALYTGSLFASAQSVTLLHPPLSGITVKGISEDGNVVVGHYLSAEHAFRWTPLNGLVTLPKPAGNTISYAMGVSLDGTVVVGHASTQNFGDHRGMRWTQAGGAVAFGPTMAQQFMAIEGCNGSGQTVFGSIGLNQLYYGFTWNLSQPSPILLPQLPGGTDARVYAMANNPELSKVGTTTFGNVTPHATLWENNTATNLWPGTSLSAATCISEDGSAIYGHRSDSMGSIGQLGWVRNGPNSFTALQYLGFFIGNRTQASVQTCTGAGSPYSGGVFFGSQSSVSFNDSIGYMISSSLGMHDLNTWLPSVGIAIPSGVILRDVVDVSNDGTAICGKAISSTSNDLGYVVRGIPCLNKPILTNNDTTVSYCNGNDIELSVSTNLPYVGTVYYQWYKDNQPLSDGLAPGGSLYLGTQSQSIIIQGSTTQDSGVFHCVAYNTCGSDESGGWNLTVYSNPLAGAPAPPEVCPGGTVSIGMFTSNVTSFLWEYYHSPLSTWFVLSDGPFFDFTSGFSANISGATTDTLTLSNTYLGYPTPIRFSGGNPCQIMAPIETLLNYPSLPTITDQPVTTSCCKGQPSSFTVGANSQLPLTYQWQLYHTGLLQWINLTDGFYVGGATGFSGTIAGSLTPTLTFTTATIGTVAPNQPFRCIVSHGCGSATTQVANLYICPGDVNCDGNVDFFDYLDFVDAFSNNDPIGDFNEDGFIDFFDYLDFVDAFSLGC